MSVGLDCGTAFIVAARKEGEKDFFNTQRDCFFDVKYAPYAEDMLSGAGARYIKKEDRLYILGDDAIKFANILEATVRRPMAKGVLNPEEEESLQVIPLIMQATVGAPREKDELLYLSIPADPADAPFDVVYHKGALTGLLTKMGYTVRTINEGLAVIFSENPTVKEKDKNTPFSGMGVSLGAGMCNVCLAYRSYPLISFSLSRCLAEGTLVCTNKGLIPIEKVKPKVHKIIDLEGRLQDVREVSDNGVRSDIYGIKTVGFPEVRKVTSDHKIFVRKGIKWEEVVASKLQVGDIVGEPVVNCTDPIQQFYFGNETLKRGQSRKVECKASRNFGRFLGIFLGDGHVRHKTGIAHYHVSISFNEDELDKLQKYQTIVKTLFPDVSVRIARHDYMSGYVQLFITDKIISKRMLDFYDTDGNKILPISLDQIPNNMALGIIEGLLDSDGYKCSFRCTREESVRRVGFSTTSSQLFWVFRQLLGRFGIHGVLSLREPKEAGMNSRGVKIIGKKLGYEYYVQTLHEIAKLKSLLTEYEKNQTYPIPEQFIITTIKFVEKLNETYKVYDLVTDSPASSFSLPYITVHNSGDWIDQKAAIVRNRPVSEVTTYKETEFNFEKENPSELDEAIKLYYENLVEYIAFHFKNEFEKSSKGRFPGKMSIVVSGGTSKPKGFVNVFREVIGKAGLPLEIGEVRAAQDPLVSTAKGCLVAAISEQKKAQKKEEPKVEEKKEEPKNEKKDV